MAWKKGQSGNPNGRPKKGYALTDMLTRELNKLAYDIDGKRHRNKTILTRVAVEAATTGSITFPKVSPSGEVHAVTRRLEPRDWMTWVKFLFDRVEGPSTQKLELSGTGGGPVVLEWPDNTTTESP